ncbi:MAG: carboxymuconolactone decarboxylase family protein [Thermoleophilia bacterium]
MRTLQGLAAGQRAVVGGLLGLTPGAGEEEALDARTRALVGVAALVAVNGAGPEHRTQVEAALGAGATAEEIVGVLVAVAPHVGTSRVVAASAAIADALGVDAPQGPVR